MKWTYLGIGLLSSAAATAMAQTPSIIDGGAMTITPGAMDRLPSDPSIDGCGTVYETFNDTFEPNYGSGWTISNGFVGCWGPSARFTADASFELCEIRVSATHVTGTNDYTVTLHEDGGSIPGDPIMSWQFTDIPQNQAGPTPLLVADATGICVEEGVGYWLSFQCTEPTGDAWGVLRLSTMGGVDGPSANFDCSNWVSMGTRNPGAWQVTGIEGCGGIGLEITGSCPGSMTASASGATPGGNVAFAYAFGTGNQVIPSGPCAGTELGLNNTATLLGTATADASGNASLTGNAPAGACGRVFVQAVDATSCATSNVVGI